ncbi:MAG: histidinol-phosphate transaminase [Chloroflexi bacterium]|nr:histidinol-phosphate transaminase [Chloroflexota bacterium]
MSFDFSTLIRPDILEQPLFQWTNSLEAASKRLGIPVENLAKLSSNENLYGPSPKVIEAVARFNELHYYPDPMYLRLREALSKHTGAPIERIAVGNGLDEVIQMLMRVLLRPGDAIIDCPPSFEMYRMEASMAHGRTVNVPRSDEDFSLNLDGIEAAVAAEPGIKALWLTAPNNPDGTLLPPEHLKRLLNLPVFVIVDEAYADFAPYNFMDWTLKYDNLAVLRTFSKGPALAGLRIGYGVFPRILADNLWKITPPFNINAIGAVAATAALEDWDYTKKIAGLIIEEREKLFEELSQFPFLQPVRGHGSFLLARVEGRSAADLAGAMAKHGCLIRSFDSEYVKNCIRISIGTPRETRMVVDALKAIVAS